MKNLVLAFLAVAIALPSLAQKKFEGSVVYTISYKDLPAEMAAFEAMLPGEMTTRISGQKTRVEQSMGMGMEQVIISDMKAGTGTLLMDMMGKKIAVEMSKDELKKFEEKQKNSEVTIEYVDGDTKTIAGYECKKAKVLTGAAGSVEVYYTEELPAGANKEFEELKGFPLEYMVDGGQFKMLLSATDVKKEKLDKGLFSIPEGYDKQTFTEFETTMKGMMGGQ